ncbi:MAG: hypothetical protein WDZ82_00895 [Candidatus Paceibacterota bacterium]
MENFDERHEVNEVEAKIERSTVNFFGKEGEILEAVKRGRERFLNDSENYGVRPECFRDRKDVEAEAFIAALTSTDQQERENKAYFVHAIHVLDDYFDEIGWVNDPEILYENRSDIEKVLKSLGDVGKFGTNMIESVEDHSSVRKGIQKVMYGGLLAQNSSDKEKRGKLIQEYVKVGTELIDENFTSDIEKIDPTAYFMTNKVAMELINANEKDHDVNVSEAWNLIFTPALYYHNLSEEEKREVSGFNKDEEPDLEEEMIKMVNLGFSYTNAFSDSEEKRKLRMDQFKLVCYSFKKVLPEAIFAEYMRHLE